MGSLQIANHKQTRYKMLVKYIPGAYMNFWRCWVNKQSPTRNLESVFAKKVLMPGIYIFAVEGGVIAYIRHVVSRGR